MTDLSVPEVLNYTYGFMVRNMSREDRMEFDEMLRPEPEIVKSLLPARLRNMTPPPGWKAVTDPFKGT